MDRMPVENRRSAQTGCPDRDRMSVESSISNKRPSRQGRNVFVFPLMYRLFVNKSQVN
jgi:hypothetical protein